MLSDVTLSLHFSTNNFFNGNNIFCLDGRICEDLLWQWCRLLLTKMLSITCHHLFRLLLELCLVQESLNVNRKWKTNNILICCYYFQEVSCWRPLQSVFIWNSWQRQKMSKHSLGVRYTASTMLSMIGKTTTTISIGSSWDKCLNPDTVVLQVLPVWQVLQHPYVATGSCRTHS